MNIVVIGYRGTGKSVVAKLIAQALGMEDICMDEEIVRRAGMRIPEIVEQHGWSFFRDMESELVKELAQRDGLVIDTGGGVIERARNVKALKANGKVVWLDATVETILERIKDGSERPALSENMTFTQEVAGILGRRKPLYAAAADIRVTTPAGDGTPEAVARAALEALESFFTAGLGAFESQRG